MTKTFSVTLHFDKCTVVQAMRDDIMFQLSHTDACNRPIEHLQQIHAGYDEFNDRVLSIYTVRGNGADLARNLGWVGEITVMHTRNKTKTVFPAGSYPGDESWTLALENPQPL